MSLRSVHALVLLLLAFVRPVAAQPTYVTTDDDPQVVNITAQHTLGSVEGTLHPVAGQLTFDPDAPADSLSGRFIAILASLDTGIGLRDRDMRENYLEVDEYPKAVFTLDDAAPDLRDAGGDTLRLAVTGSMTLHGVTRPEEVVATLLPTPDGLQVTATFSILLSDYAIDQPKRFLMKVADEVAVEVVLFLVSSF